VSNQPIPLNYRGAAGAASDLDDLGTFNARTAIRWKGDFIFRIYHTNDRLFFIKLGSSKRSNQQVAFHFGLIGAIVAHFASKSSEKKAKEKMYQFAGMKPAELLGKDKANHVTLLSEISEPTLGPRSFWSNNKFGYFSFKDAKGKKKMYTFEDADNFRDAERNLPQIFGDKLSVQARWDDQRRKIVKVK